MTLNDILPELLNKVLYKDNIKDMAEKLVVCPDSATPELRDELLYIIHRSASHVAVDNKTISDDMYHDTVVRIVRNCMAMSGFPRSYGCIDIQGATTPQTVSDVIVDVESLVVGVVEDNLIQHTKDIVRKKN